jgi:hypothetical protein
MFTILFMYYSAFLRAVFFALTGAAAVAVVAFLEATRFNLALIVLRLLALPNEPMVLLPFADFLSPLPMGFI